MRARISTTAPTLAVMAVVLLGACGPSSTDAARPATGAAAAPTPTAPAPAQLVDVSTDEFTDQAHLVYLLPRHLPAGAVLTAASIHSTPADQSSSATTDPPLAVADQAEGPGGPGRSALESETTSNTLSGRTTSSWQLTAAGGPVTITITGAPSTRAEVDATAAMAAAAPGSLRDRTVSVAASTGHLLTATDSSTSTLLWFDGGTAVEISGDVSADDLVAVAEGLEPVDEAAWLAAVDDILDIEISASGTWSGHDWSVSIGHDPEGWCGDAATDVGDVSACETSDSGRHAATILLVEPSSSSQLRVFGATTLDATTVELVEPDGAVVATALLSIASPSAYQAFALWPDRSSTHSVTGYDVVLRNATGDEISRQHLDGGDTIDPDGSATTDPADATACPDPSQWSDTADPSDMFACALGDA